MNIENDIAVINKQLKADLIGVTIVKIGNRLSLQATLPVKNTSKNHSQRISLGLYANRDGLIIAESKARHLGYLLLSNQFNWESYFGTAVSLPLTVSDWVLKLEADYFNCRRRTLKSETTWKGDYLKVFKNLPPGEILTKEIILVAILKTPPDTRTRKRTCMALGALARFAEIAVDTRKYAGKYGVRSTVIRNLPEDEDIVYWYCQIKNPSWRWFFGVVATYGLRNHEVFHVDFNRLISGSYILEVKDGKTGHRRVWPCYPEWFEQFRLAQVNLPPINLERSNSAIGNSCTHYFRDTVKLPFHLYDLRHCWAIRTLHFGLDITLAAQQMGHSLEIHTQVYHRWITDQQQQRAFDALMLRPNRPQPPLFKLEQF